MHSTGRLTREDLELTLAIVEEGTITRAALRLHLSQSALSHHLRSLENRVGAPLFQRGARRMIPTALGEELTEQARRICSHFRDSEEALAHLLENQRRIIRLGTECYTSYHWLPSLVRGLSSTFKDIDLRIVVEATRRPTAALVSGETDAAIFQSSREDRRLTYWPLFRDELVLLVSARHSLAKRKFIWPGDLSGDTLFLHDVGGGRQAVVEEFLVPAKAYPKFVREVQLTEAIIEMVRAEMGVSVLARWLIEPHIRKKDLVAVRLGPKGMWRDWRLATLRDHARLPEIEQLSKLLPTLLRPQFAKSRRQ